MPVTNSETGAQVALMFQLVTIVENEDDERTRDKRNWMEMANGWFKAFRQTRGRGLE